jgi:hypothetical protein
MTDQVTATISGEKFEALITALSMFMDESCASLCMDNDHDREEAAHRIVHWLFKDKTLEMSPEQMLPKANYKLGFNIVDEVSGERIVQLLLERDRQMTDGDFLQMQNFFWCTVGRAIRDNPDIIRQLRAGGIDVNTDPGDSGNSGQQFAS